MPAVVQPGDERTERRCEWCDLPQTGELSCTCDSPRFVEMTLCQDCEDRWLTESELYLSSDSHPLGVNLWVCRGCRV